MSSIQNLLNPEELLSSSCESVGSIFICRSSVDLLCSDQRQHNTGRNQHRLSLRRIQAQTRQLEIPLDSKEGPNAVIMSHTPIVQTPSLVSQTQTADHNIHFPLYYVVRY